MPLNPELVGRRYASESPYEVGREKVREFADAIGDPNPAYRDPAAAQALGYPDVIAPPTFATVISLAAAGQVALDPELGMNHRAIVHRDQRFSYTRPIQVGDRLLAVTHIEDLRSVAGSDLLTARIEIGTEEGEPVLTATSTLVARSESE
jgi:acyl dehydratase